MTKLSTHQQAMLEHARSHGGRVYAADYFNPNAIGRAAAARSLASFYRTVNSLVRKGLLRQLKHPQWSVQGWELVAPKQESQS